MRKNRYFVLLSLGLLFVLVFNLAGCASAKYVHAVFFTLKPETPQVDIDGLVDDCCEMLTEVPSVRRIESGRRDVKAARKVNDQDFHVGLVVYFDDKAGYDAYEVHPTHQALVKKHKTNFKSVRVCDFIAK
ncbi:MAG: Dabb family protein [Planctomycetota bacterium]|jgi:hypothetical protein